MTLCIDLIVTVFAALEWLPQNVERVPVKFRQFVQKQCSAVDQAPFSWTRG